MLFKFDHRGRSYIINTDLVCNIYYQNNSLSIYYTLRKDDENLHYTFIENVNKEEYDRFCYAMEIKDNVKSLELEKEYDEKFQKDLAEKLKSEFPIPDDILNELKKKNGY